MPLDSLAPIAALLDTETEEQAMARLNALDAATSLPCVVPPGGRG